MSKATMRLLLQSAAIEKASSNDNKASSKDNNECHAEVFTTYTKQDDYAFAKCLQSATCTQLTLATAGGGGDSCT